MATPLTQVHPRSLGLNWQDVSARTGRPTILNESTLDALIHARSTLKYEGYQPNGGAVTRDNWQTPWSRFRPIVQQLRGADHLAARIESSLARMEAPPSTTQTWAMAPAGAYPIVPVALGGDPCSMRYRTEEATHTAPLRVYYPLICSTAVKEEQYADVLSDILGALRMLSDRRAVELIGYGGNAFSSDDVRKANGVQNCGQFTTFPIPIDFGDSRAAALFADVSIGRTLLMGIHFSNGRTRSSGPWPWDVPPHEPHIIRDTRAALGLAEDDILIPPLFGRSGIETVRKHLVEAAALSGIELTFPA